MIIISGGLKTIISYIQKNYNDYFLFDFAYVPSNVYRFVEIDRFIQESVAEFAPFKNEYIGPAAVNITDWCKNTTNSYFEAFLYYLADRCMNNCKNKIILFSECSIPIEIENIVDRIFGEYKSVCLEQEYEFTNSTVIGFSA